MAHADGGLHALVGQHGDPGRGAEHAAALAWADFVYDPEVQAPISDYFATSPRSRASTRCDPELADDQLIFPTDEFTANCSAQPNPPGDDAEVQEVTSAFQDVVTG